MIVVDASVVANAVGDDGGAGLDARDLLRHNDAVAPDLLDVETTSSFRRRWLAGEMTLERFGQSLDKLAILPVPRLPTRGLMRRAFELRANVTPYDACYVALAEALGCSLWTYDRRLARASGPRCQVRLVGAGTEA